MALNKQLYQSKQAFNAIYNPRNNHIITGDGRNVVCSVKIIYLSTCHSQNAHIYNNADIVSIVIMQGVTSFRSNLREMWLCKEIMCVSKHLHIVQSS